MTKADAAAGNFLHRNGMTSLAVVRVDPQGRPDSVSYWKNDGELKTEKYNNAYEPGILVDVWV